MLLPICSHPQAKARMTSNLKLSFQLKILIWMQKNWSLVLLLSKMWRQRVPTPRQHSPRRSSLPPAPSIRSRTMLDQDRERFAEIERQRVEAETVTARALSHAIEQMEGLSRAITESSQTVANALNNIADALRQNRQ